jgi:hypothetical protein
MAIILRNHLQNMYGLNEQRCETFNPNDSAKSHDKPAFKKNDHFLDWSVVRCTSDDAYLQSLLRNDASIVAVHMKEVCLRMPSANQITS